jgi:iron(II)-dependent oxidoreductase
MVGPDVDPNRDHRRQLGVELGRARAASDEVFARLAPRAFFERPVAERHRLLFYLGHLEAFDFNTLRGLLELPSVEPALDELFARGIDPVDGSGLPTDQPADWPAVDEIRAYGRRCRERIDAALARDEAWQRPYLLDGAAVAAIIEHRLMHIETLAYLLHQLPLSCFAPSRTPGPTARSSAVGAPPRRAVAIPAGIATLGADASAEGFVWCNEKGAHDVAVPAFAVDQFPVTHGDFLAFVLAGGYHEPALWRDDDWAWRQAADLHHPHFWRRRHDGGWLLRTLAGEVPLPLDHPVHVSHAEAAAYARWRGGRLPTEAEWHRAAYGDPGHDGTPRAYPWGDAPPAPHLGNFDLVHDDTTPVTAHPAGASAWGVHDLLGNGWEWTSTPFAPFAAFEPYPFYRGYSADFFDGKHYVLKGGSARTAARLLRRSFRNWFQPHYPYVYATFRLVEE